MNKTININLAGLFFHIDEDAYNKLQKYLAAVRRSFSGMQGSEEIMADIESRVAELFLEKRANEQQVISITHVEDVISIMGQPEDYEVDEEIFEGERKSTAQEMKSRFSRPLFRDTLNGYIGGVCAGLGHFLGIDAIWVRIFFVVISFISFPFNVLTYIIFWIVAKDAVTTNQRLAMMGKEVNISNIGENFKSGFDDVVDGQTDADYRIVGQKGKRGTVRFFSFLGRFIKGIFKAIAKIIGLFMFLLGATGLIALFFSLIGIGTAQLQSDDFMLLMNMSIPSNLSTWWIYLTAFFLIGIPFFIIAVLGLRLLVSNLASIGRTAKVIIGLLWVASVIGLCVIIATIGTSQAFDGNVNSLEKFPVNKEKVFQLNMEDSTLEGYDNIYVNGSHFSIGEFDGAKEIRLMGIKTAIAATTDSVASINVKFKAKGPSIQEAKEKASQIEYNYVITDSIITLDDFFKINSGSLNNHKIEIIVNLPEGSKARMNDEFANHYRDYISNDAFSLGSNDSYTYQVKDGKAVCLDCPVVEESKDDIEKDEINSPSRSTDDNEWKYEDDEDEENKTSETTTIKTSIDLGPIEIETEESF
ncbi:PspC domain-containing protein [Nonlabens sp. Asnod3-H03]|uniref:PspC domain-containing protein n=1 Tax=Nonlabens sp. Asnod3-H03 TaxID=3160580 RepID=UPI0038678DAF